jgi:hypothetical protein
MRKLQGVLLWLVAVAFATRAEAVTITFDETDVGLVHGSLVSKQYAGVTISAESRRGKPKPAVAFDSDRKHTKSPDLEFGKQGWKRGNLSDPPVPLGNLLIINANEKLCWTGVCSKPESEEEGGSLIFEFDTPLLSLGFDLIDIDDRKKDKKHHDDHGWGGHGDCGDHGGWDDWFTHSASVRHDDRDRDWDDDRDGDWGHHDRDDDDHHHGHGDKKSELDGSVTFTDSATGVSIRIGMMDFLAGFEVGNNSANRIPPFLASELGLDSFDIVEIRLKGTGAIDNLTFEIVPEPATLGMLGLGMAALSARARARRR